MTHEDNLWNVLLSLFGFDPEGTPGPEDGIRGHMIPIG